MSGGSSPVRSAIQAGEARAILPGGIDPHDIDLSLAAVELASLQWPVFPIEPAGKRPLVPDWPNAASIVIERVAAWWRRWPQANIGVLCGPGSGLFVLDIDHRDSVDGLATLLELTRDRESLPRTTSSRTGLGCHLFFRWPQDRRVGNSASLLGAGLDVRGEGGYVVAPPSRHVSGGYYTWRPGRDPWSTPPQPAPAWLVDMLDPPASPAPLPLKSLQALDDRYVGAALRWAAQRVATAPVGSRNAILNKEAFSLARFVVAGQLDAETLADTLAEVAICAGLEEREVGATLASALRARVRGHG